MVFIIAEAGVNHNGDIYHAHELITQAARCRANAVKFQAFTPDLLCGPGAQRDMLAKLALPDGAWQRLRTQAHDLGLSFIVTPFDVASLQLIKPYVDFIKIGSGEVQHHEFLRAVAATNKRIILSTGMSTMVQTRDAVEVLGYRNIAYLLHCVSAYPAPVNACNLACMESLHARFLVPTGWSDHTGDITVAVAAAARGAECIEAHLTLDRHADGPDHACSLNPEQFAAMVRGVNVAAEAIGSGVKEVQPCELDTLAKTRRGADGRRA